MPPTGLAISASWLPFSPAPSASWQHLDRDAPDLLSRALLFYVMSLSIAFVLQLPFRASTDELWIPFVVTISMSFLSLFVGTVVVTLAFRIVGEEAPYSSI